MTLLFHSHFLLNWNISSSLKFKSEMFPFILLHSYSAVIVLLSFKCFGEDKVWDWIIFAPYTIFLGLVSFNYLTRFCFWTLYSIFYRVLGLVIFAFICIFSFELTVWVFSEFLLRVYEFVCLVWAREVLDELFPIFNGSISMYFLIYKYSKNTVN